MNSPEINVNSTIDQDPSQEEPSDLAKLIAVKDYYPFYEPTKLGNNRREVVGYLSTLMKFVNGGRQDMDPMAQARLDMELSNLFYGIPEDQRFSMATLGSGRLAVGSATNSKLGPLTDDERRHLRDIPAQVVCPVTYKDVQ